MARKERNNVDYFPHSVSHGKKMFYLRSKYKNDGYTVWFMLLEELGKAEYHFLDLKDEVQLMYLSSAFMVSEELLKEIITTLVKFSEFDEELWNNESIIFNEKFIENISDAYKKRNNNCINKESLLSLLVSKGRIKQPNGLPNGPKSDLKVPDNTQRIVKDSIVEDRRVNIRRAFIENVIKQAKELNYDKSIYEPFCEYWTETDFESRLMQFQTKENFGIKSRLKRWKELGAVKEKNGHQEFKFPEAWKIKQFSTTEYQDFKKQARANGWIIKQILTTGQTSFEKDGNQVIL